MTLTIDGLKNLPLKNKVVKIDVLGEVRIRVLTGRERMALASMATADDVDEFQLMETMLRYSIIDDQGENVFDEETIARLFEVDGQAVQALLEEVQEFSGFGAGAVREAKKN